MKNYFETWWKIMIRPIYFFQKMDQKAWKEDALTFSLQTSVILSTILSLTIFFTRFFETLLPLFSDIRGIKLVIILPVAVVMFLVFYLMTFLIVIFLVQIFVFSAFYIIGVLLYFLATAGFRGKGDVSKSLKVSYYSTASLFFFLILILSVFLTKVKVLTFDQFVVEENIIFYLFCLYIWGLWSIGIKKVHVLPRWKAFLCAAFPILIAVGINFVFTLKFIDRLQKFIV